jgi:hypothetical protein
MNHFNKIQELRQTQVREGELLGELRAFLKEHLERIRKYKNGEQVECFNEMGLSIGKGIINFAFLSAGLESFEIAKYVKEPEKWEKEINEVLYRVHKIRKDGTMSTHQLATCSEKPRSFYSSLKPVK